MKNPAAFPKPLLSAVVAPIALAAGLAGCSHGKPAVQSPADGPAVVFARSEPGTVELNRNLRPDHRAIVLADVRDFRARVTSVQLRFSNAPIVVRMRNIGATTWRAELNASQLEQMAISGRIMRYQARIEARDANGTTSVSTQTVEIAVKAPELSVPEASETSPSGTG